jgi:hypothetical protein
MILLLSKDRPELGYLAGSHLFDKTHQLQMEHNLISPAYLTDKNKMIYPIVDKQIILIFKNISKTHTP